MYTINLKDISKNDIDIVGGKAANLGEMLQNNIPVPNGFVITTQAYEEYLKYNKIEFKVNNDFELYSKVKEKICNGKFSCKSKRFMVFNV